MNLRQTQRTLADVLAKCEASHVQLPVDPLDSMISAGEALRHSRVGGSFHPDDAVDELKQRYGLEPKWQQREDAAEAKRQRGQRKRLRRGDESREGQKQDATSARASGSGAGTSDTDSADASDSGSRGNKKKPRTAETSKHGSTRIDRIIENNPAKNPANEELAEEFVELGGYELEHGEKQKGISRMAVAKQIRLADAPINSGSEARKLPRVGPSAAAKIDEVLQRGKMKALEQYEAEAKGEPADEKGVSEAEKKRTTAEREPQQRSEKNTEGDAEHNEELEEEGSVEEDEEEEEEDEDGEEADDKKDDDWQDDEDESAEEE